MPWIKLKNGGFGEVEVIRSYDLPKQKVWLVRRIGGNTKHVSEIFDDKPSSPLASLRRMKCVERRRAIASKMSGNQRPSEIYKAITGGRPCRRSAIFTGEQYPDWLMDDLHAMAYLGQVVYRGGGWEKVG